MKVLVTGSTAQQTSRELMSRLTTFAGLVTTALTSLDDVHVVVREPSVAWGDDDLELFDAVVVGVSSPTSVVANRIYGALSVVDRLWGSPKLKLLVDSPDPGSIMNGLSAMAAHPENLFKEFYSNRKEYVLAQKAERSVRGAIDALLTEKWPPTLYPVLSWSLDEPDPYWLSGPLTGCGHRINLDSWVSVSEDSPGPLRKVWAFDGRVFNKRWVEQQRLTWPIEQLPARGLFAGDTPVVKTLATCSALLAPPQKRDSDVWWTPRVIQSLLVGTPVCTSWKTAQKIGSPWALLGEQVESFAEYPEGRRLLVSSQLHDYLAATPSRSASAEHLRDVVS